MPHARIDPFEGAGKSHVLEHRQRRQPAGRLVRLCRHRHARAEILVVPRPWIDRLRIAGALVSRAQGAVRVVPPVTPTDALLERCHLLLAGPDASADCVRARGNLRQHRSDPARTNARIAVGRRNDPAGMSSLQKLAAGLIHHQAARLAHVSVRGGQRGFQDLQLQGGMPFAEPAGDSRRIVGTVVRQDQDCITPRIEPAPRDIGLGGQGRQGCGNSGGFIAHRHGDDDFAQRRGQGSGARPMAGRIRRWQRAAPTACRLFFKVQSGARKSHANS
jgi:hypothetical protein